MKKFHPMPTFRAQLGAYAERYANQPEIDGEARRGLALPSDSFPGGAHSFIDAQRAFNRAYERDLVAITGNPDGEGW